MLGSLLGVLMVAERAGGGGTWRGFAAAGLLAGIGLLIKLFGGTRVRE